MWNWLDARTNYRAWLALWRNRSLPNGPSWWLTSASVLFWLFVIQVATGLLLMTTYSPSTTTAWASVHYIQQSTAGAFVRGVHHFASHAMIVFFAIHVVRVMLTGAFRAPRELVWLTGLLLLPLMIVWAVTGNPLTGGQKGVSQIEVEGNIVGSTPVIGPLIQRVLIGGDRVGHLTFTHLYFLHVGLLPLLAGGLLIVHLTQAFRHGPAPLRASVSPVPYWPYQSIRNTAVLAATLGAIAYIAIRNGAPLDSPADPDVSHMPRPEWYFRWLFELRRYFTGDLEFVATMVIPAALLLVFVSMPFFDWLFPRALSAPLRCTVVLATAGGIGWLTWMSFDRDWRDAEYLASEQAAHDLAKRAYMLASERSIPPEGPAALLREDAKTQGPMIFQRHCANCHSYADAAGEGIVAPETSAPNLHGFGSAEWAEGLLDSAKLASDDYFGRTKFKTEGEMAGHLASLVEGADPEAQAKTREHLALAARALAAEAALPARQDADLQDAEKIAQGKLLIAGDLGCTDCHRFHGDGELGSAPDLTGYASRDWLQGMIADPQGQRFYPNGRNDRMPSFAADDSHPAQNLLDPRELRLLVDWLRGEWFEPEAASADSLAARYLAHKENLSSQPIATAAPGD